jgi:FAD/FMN-containing dehydrogenase
MATVLDHPAADTLVSGFHGRLFTPSDQGYEEARAIYNAMIDRRPALVARCRNATDVIAAVRFGRATGRDVAVRGGGHNGAGLGTVDGGPSITSWPRGWCSPMVGS